jgi:hypothetical protein
MSDAKEVDAVIRARQLACKHGWLPNHQPERCAHCGVSRGDWNEMKPDPWVGVYGGIFP